MKEMYCAQIIFNWLIENVKLVYLVLKRYKAKCDVPVRSVLRPLLLFARLCMILLTCSVYMYKAKNLNCLLMTQTSASCKCSSLVSTELLGLLI